MNTKLLRKIRKRFRIVKTQDTWYLCELYDMKKRAVVHLGFYDWAHSVYQCQWRHAINSVMGQYYLENRRKRKKALIRRNKEVATFNTYFHPERTA
jgi:hypothetical protein